MLTFKSKRQLCSLCSPKSYFYMTIYIAFEFLTKFENKISEQKYSTQERVFPVIIFSQGKWKE